MNRSLFWGLAAGAAYAYLATRPARTVVTLSLDAEPEDLLNLVAQVEREPEFIPFIERVRVESREEPSVVYRVETRMLGVPGWARFMKRIIPNEGHAEWWALGGTGGLRQAGQFTSRKQEGRALTTVQTNTHFSFPVVGPLLAHFSVPFTAYAFTRWLKNLEKEAGKGTPEPSSAVAISGASPAGGVTDRR